MKSFSQRLGLKPIKSNIQNDYIDDDLTNSLWNALTIYYWEEIIRYDHINSNDKSAKTFLNLIWINFFKKRLDEQPLYFKSYLSDMKDFFFSADWNEIYDFIEFIPLNYSPDPYNINHSFKEYCNNCLEKELSAYRFVNGVITQISSKEEIESIEDALNIPSKYDSVHIHLNRSLELFSDKKTPDYRNSIKESISAVESYCSILTGDSKATLGQALKIIEKTNKIHPALKNSLSNLYGYTSEGDGIRHGLLEENNLSQEDAKFMLVVCSAFINYLKQKEAKALK